LLVNPLVKEHRRAVSGPSLSDAGLARHLLLHPEIAAERLELLSHSELTSGAVADLANALASVLSENPQMSAAELRSVLERAGHPMRSPR
jgi:hypothetical protein